MFKVQLTANISSGKYFFDIMPFFVFQNCMKQGNVLLSLLSTLVYNMPVSIRYDWNCMGHINFWSVLMIFILF